jgi:FAD/FMN-containing dehydrogenase
MRAPFATDPRLRARYSQGAGIYRLIPAAVARPRSLDELRSVLAAARIHGLTVTPRGAGSGMDGSNVGAGLVLDLTEYDPHRCTVDAAAQRASVSPSVMLSELNHAAANRGLRFPVDPSSGAWATIGGMISTNASGPRSVRHGSVRNWIESITLETADGPLELARNREPDRDHPAVRRWYADGLPLVQRHMAAIRKRFPHVRKNSAGYALNHYLPSGDLIDLVIGSEGTLGVITGAHVLLETVPSHRMSLRVAVRSRADLFTAIESLRAHDPATLELLDRSFLRLIADREPTPERPGLFREAGGIILADFEGDDSRDVEREVKAAMQSVNQIALDVRIAADRDEIERLWTIRHAASPILAGLTDGRRSLQVIEDGCVPVARLAEYLDAVEAATTSQRIDAVMFGHAGDGHLHVNLLPNLREPDWKARVRAVFDSVTDAVLRLGGTPSGEHGAGRLRAAVLERMYGPEVMECFRAVKHAFDPSGLFNPGVILGDGSDPLASLKVGADAAPLPDGIEEYLNQIEVEARWGESRWSG